LVRYEHRSFPIGSKEPVEVVVDLACCLAGVQVRAVDVAGYEVFFLTYIYMYIVYLIMYVELHI